MDVSVEKILDAIAEHAVETDSYDQYSRYDYFDYDDYAEADCGCPW